ncbi:hypothetical protein MTR_2g090940 [Medicago truncatula]|uniref:Uncharacterized protein n=1 Tax=Medicago truncatula TaxID=3880 RepID=G7ZVI9_MEDTR|nr:hypothetical protein MTR_2g090940 [Medicago truncatula]
MPVRTGLLHDRSNMPTEPVTPPVHGRTSSTGRSSPVFKTMISLLNLMISIQF